MGVGGRHRLLGGTGGLLLEAGGRGSLERRLGRLRFLRPGLLRCCSRSKDLRLGQEDPGSRDPRSSHRCRLSLCGDYCFSPATQKGMSRCRFLFGAYFRWQTCLFVSSAPSRIRIRINRFLLSCGVQIGKWVLLQANYNVWMLQLYMCTWS